MKTPTTNSLGTRILAPLVAAGLLFAAAAPADAELREVDQTIFGMDCAPCAVGVEKRIGKLEGVSRVTLSLNEGKAVVQFAPENRLTLEEIRDAIRRNAFDPREAKIEVAGVLTIGEQGERVIETEAGERFILQQDEKAPEAWRAIEQIESGEQTAIRGTTPAGKKGPWKVSVTGSEVG